MGRNPDVLFCPTKRVSPTPHPAEHLPMKSYNECAGEDAAMFAAQSPPPRGNDVVLLDRIELGKGGRLDAQPPGFVRIDGSR